MKKKIIKTIESELSVKEIIKNNFFSNKEPTFKAKNLVTPQTPKAEYQKKYTSKISEEDHEDIL